MALFDRFKYAFFSAVIVIGILTLAMIVFSLDIGGFVFSYNVFIPVFVISYIFAPIIERYIKFK